MSPRLQRWLADRLPFIRSPDVDPFQRARPSRFAYDMPWERRLGIALVGTFGLLFAAFVFAAAVFVIWAVLTA